MESIRVVSDESLSLVGEQKLWAYISFQQTIQRGQFHNVRPRLDMFMTARSRYDPSLLPK